MPIEVVKLSSIGGLDRGASKYAPYIKAALAMGQDEALCVNIANLVSLRASVYHAIIAAGQKGALRVIQKRGVVWIVKK